jgi:hypothetical protein
MNRRQFLFTSFVSGTGLMMPNVVTPAVKNYTRPRTPLIVHTVVIRPRSNHFDTGVFLKVKKSNGKNYLIHQGTALGMGDLLNIRLISVDMGHHLIGLYEGDNEIRQFRSWIVGGMIERGEPLIAAITDTDKDNAFRIDIFLNRLVKHGDRIPLLDPVTEKYGISAQMAKNTNDKYRSVSGEWNPVRALPWHHFHTVHFSKPKKTEYGYVYMVDQEEIENGFVAINKRRKNIWHPTPWNDLRPAATILTQYGSDFAYLPFGLEHNVEQLLLRGEKIEAKIVRPGKSLPREVLVSLSLVA